MSRIWASFGSSSFPFLSTYHGYNPTKVPKRSQEWSNPWKRFTKTVVHPVLLSGEALRGRLSDLQIGFENASMDWEAKIPANRREMTIGAEKAPLLKLPTCLSAGTSLREILYLCWFIPVFLTLGHGGFNDCFYALG